MTMKKLFISFTVVMAIAVMLTGCGGGTEKARFTATVKEAGESSILVTPSEDSGERNSADLISVHISEKTKIYDNNGKKTDAASIKTGFTVEITYNGMIAESYPAQIWADKIRIADTAV
jgi:uncharacterized lipoprotein YehR (DUF1307 family)